MFSGYIPHISQVDEPLQAGCLGKSNYFSQRPNGSAAVIL